MGADSSLVLQRKFLASLSSCPGQERSPVGALTNVSTDQSETINIEGIEDSNQYGYTLAENMFVTPTVFAQNRSPEHSFYVFWNPVPIDFWRVKHGS